MRGPTQLRWLLLIAFITVPDVCIGAEELDPFKVVSACIAGNKDNYSRIETAKGVLIEEATSSPRLLKQLAPQKTSKSGGYSVEYDINEKEKYTQQFVITAERQKYTGGMLKDTITIVEPTHVTIYNPKEKKVTIEKRQGLNVRWRNPRELIFFFDVDRLEDVLSKARILEGAAVDGAGGRRVRIKYEDALSRPCLLEVDPSKNHLPVRLAELDLNDRMMRYHEVTLKRVDGIKEPTWFPESAMQISFFESVPVFTSSDKNFASRSQFRIEKLEVNKPVDKKEFELVYPKGTRVFNTITGKANEIR